MPKQVLDVGNCDLDHDSIRRLLTENFPVAVVRAHTRREALEQLAKRPFDLVLANRVFECDGDEGLALVDEMKRRPELSATPVMLITNFPEHQEAAVRRGAEPGFGKRELDSPQTRDKLARFLGE